MINLHSIVKPAITALHPDETVTLYRSLGITNVKGEIKTKYAAGSVVKAQIQSLSDDKLFHSGRTGQNNTTRKAYLFSEDSTTEKPAPVIRPISRTGDMVKRADDTWWLVESLLEDFSHAGWVCVGLVLQTKAPEL